jgi:tRNA nucleotidyltransferase/poly(A) polymerase
MKHEIFEVGGCVRDEILGVSTKDIDFTFVLGNTDMTVDQGWDEMLTFLNSQGFKIFLETKDCFTVRAMFPKGHQHESLVADFVMARKEVGVIAGTRKPILELGSLSDDLRRRDFTVNALAKDSNGVIIDEWNGIQDLKEMVLKTPLDPIITLADDPLRLLRALRFSITKGFRIDEPLMEAMLQPGLLRKLQDVVSQERIREEIQKMMKHDTIKSIKLIQEVPGLLEVIFTDGMWLMPTTKIK